MSRAVLAALLVVGGLGAAATPAAAYCDPRLYRLTGYCNGCELTADAYARADAASGDALPDRHFACPD